MQAPVLAPCISMRQVTLSAGARGPQASSSTCLRCAVQPNRLRRWSRWQRPGHGSAPRSGCELGTRLDCCRHKALGSDATPSAGFVQPALARIGAGIAPGRWSWCWVNTSLGFVLRHSCAACNFTSSSPMCRVELASLCSLRSMPLASNQSLLTGWTWASSDLNCSRTGQPGPQLQPSLALVKTFNFGVMTGIET